MTFVLSKLNHEDKEQISSLAKLAYKSTVIDSKYYEKYDVKRGLRDINGAGVLAGLTEISDIISFREENGAKVPTEGELYYRGIDIKKIVKGFVSEKRFGFEETVYLLLFGELPDKNKLEEFKQLLVRLRAIPKSFVRDIIMKAPSDDMMNSLARSVLALYPYDHKADDITIPNVLRQCLQLIAQFPSIAVYSYQVNEYYNNNNSLIIHQSDDKLSTAENILHLLRPDSRYSELEAELLDICLVLHAEHGGGNNSTFTTHVVSSSGADTYSVVAASLGSLKGPRHGGANIKVVKMFEDIKANVPDGDEGKMKDYLAKILDKEAFDKSGLIYGMGHAVYSLSDPRADILKYYVKLLAEEKHLDKEYEFYEKIERLAPEVISDRRKIYKGVCPNIDFYSGFVYNMLGLPLGLFTPMFAVSRIAGWSAHRIEELSNKGKIIRPGYCGVCGRREYVSLGNR